MRIGRPFWSLSLTFLFLALSAYAQMNPNTDVGLNPFGSYDGSGIDSVNLATGDLTIHIPLFSYPQRGTLKSASVMALNAKIFKVFQNCNSQTGVCNDSWKLSSGFPWTIPGITIRDVNFLQQSWTYNATLKTYVYTRVTWDGAFHQMAPKSTGTGFESTDNTAMWMSGTPLSPSSTGTIIKSNGDMPYQDSNGNYISTTTNTDTIGRTSPATISTSDYSGCGGPASQITSATIRYYPSPSGANTQVKVCVALISLQTNFRSNNVDMLDSYVALQNTRAGHRWCRASSFITVHLGRPAQLGLLPTLTAIRRTPQRLITVA
jgi:hypothetical protein